MLSAAQPRSKPLLPSGMKMVDLCFGSWTALVFLFLYLPIILLVVFSFNASKLNIIWTGFTWQWYEELFRNAPLVKALKNSLVIASITTFFSVILGTLGAWLLHRYNYPGRRALSTLIFVPMVIPEIIMGISLLIFFTTIHFSLGFTTVIISHITFCFPFVLIAVQARLNGLDPFLEEAAMDLGARPLEAFFQIILPYLMPAIISGALMSFTLSMDEVIVTYFTTSPASATLPMKVFGMAKVGLNPMLNAISAIFIVATALLVVTAEMLKRWNK